MRVCLHMSFCGAQSAELLAVIRAQAETFDAQGGVERAGNFPSEVHAGDDEVLPAGMDEEAFFVQDAEGLVNVSQ